MGPPSYVHARRCRSFTTHTFPTSTPLGGASPTLSLARRRSASAAGFGFFFASDSDSDAFAAADSSAASVACTRQYPSETPGRNSPSFSRRVPSSSRGGRRHSSPTPPEEGARTHSLAANPPTEATIAAVSGKCLRAIAFARTRPTSHSGSESRPERCMRSAGRDGEESSSPRAEEASSSSSSSRGEGIRTVCESTNAASSAWNVATFASTTRTHARLGSAATPSALVSSNAGRRSFAWCRARRGVSGRNTGRACAARQNGSVQRLTANASRKPRTPCLIESAAWTYDANAAYGATNANHRAASPNWKPSSAYPGGDAMARRARAPGGDAGRNRRRRRRGSSFSVLLIGVPTVVPSNCQKRACRLRFLA